MCQKAFGAFYGPYVAVNRNQVTWTRGEPRLFSSSELVSRGFCSECGTQLTFEGNGFYDLAIGAFDDPSAIRPTLQIGVANKLPWVDEMSALSGWSQHQQASADRYLATVVSNQHPDHDTTDWSPKG